MKLKICTTGKPFDKLYLGTFFRHVEQRRDKVRHEGKEDDSIFGWGVTSSRRMRFKILGMGENPILIPHK